MDTKFCYYNNYNVNQPRHFCNNCQRYWTGGGTMKNIHVGASHKKNKRLASHWCKGEPTRVGDLVKENGVAVEEAEDEDDQAEEKEGGEKELVSRAAMTMVPCVVTVWLRWSWRQWEK
ncbi:hypothetical protein JHK84_036827 [Glycine max]|nr:hypothetical protein JHK84_036827 [Glycine max]